MASAATATPRSPAGAGPSDEQQLFIADTRVNHIRIFDVGDDGTLSNSREFAT